MRAARAWQITPTQFFKLSEVDRVLMRGLIHLEEHTKSHGYPDWVSEDPKNMGEFVATMHPDFALAALDSLLMAQKEPTPGYRPRVSMHPREKRPEANQ